MTFALFLFQHGEEASQAAHGAQAAGEAASHGGGHHTPWIVEQVNHLLGPLVYPIQKAVMTSINPNWHGDEANPIPGHVVMAVISLLICTVGLYLFRGKLSVDNPSSRQQVLEGIALQVRELLDQVIGPYGRKYFPVVCSFAVFILLSNLMGIIPGLEAPTVNLNVTLALGLSSFLYYLSMGFKQQGFGYLKHFTGGLIGDKDSPGGIMGILLFGIGLIIFVVEIISNFVRPGTLGVRLFINIFADEQIAGAFSAIMAWVVPSVLLVLAVFVAFVQTFIFVMLSIVYLSETVPHDDHHEEHGHGEEHHAGAH